VLSISSIFSAALVHASLLKIARCCLCAVTTDGTNAMRAYARFSDGDFRG